MVAQLNRHAERGDSFRRSSDMYMGGAMQRGRRENMTAFKALIAMLFIILLCIARWEDPHVLECDGKTLVVSRAYGSSEGGESHDDMMHTLEDVDEGRRGKIKDREQGCYCILTTHLDHTPQDKMPSEKDNSPTGSVQMSTPTKQGSSASSNVKTSGRSAKSKRGNGSMRKFLDEDGELDAEDVMVVGKLLAKLGFFKVEDLRILGEAFFETMMPDTPPVVVYKLWKVMHHNGYLDEDRRLPAPSYRLTTKYLKEGVPELKKGVTSLKSKPTRMFGEPDDGAAPEEFAYQRVIDRPKARAKKSGIFNPYSLTGRENEEDASSSKVDDQDSGLWEAFPTWMTFWSLRSLLRMARKLRRNSERR